MKVLHLIDSQGVYGAERVLLALIEEQRKQGIDAILVSIGERGIEEKQIEQEARALGIPLITFRMRNGPNPFGAYRLLRFVKNQGFDLVHSHGYKPNILLGFIPKKIRKTPVIATLHGWTSTHLFTKLTLYEWLDARSLRFLDHVVVVSKSMLSVLQDSRIRATVIHNGIVCRNGREKPFQDVDPIAHFCRTGFVVGSVGRLSEEKGYRYLVEAIHHLRRAGIDARLVIIGEGPERALLTRMIAEMNLTSWALLPGYKEDASAYMHCFDVFILSSLTEGLPITLLEAMQAGIPVIATSVGGIPEVLSAGKTGLLVRAGDSHSLAGALLRLYHSGKLRATLSVKGKRLVSDCFTKEIMTRRYCEVYKKVLDGKTALEAAG